MTDSRADTWRIAAANGLLVTGLASGGPAMPGGGWALLLLAAIGAAGVLAATALPEVSDRASRDG